VRPLYCSSLRVCQAYNITYVTTANTGRGAVYRYDAVGSSERVAAVCCGKGEHLIQPLLDEVTGMEEDLSLWELAPDGENAFLSQSLHATPDSSDQHSSTDHGGANEDTSNISSRKGPTVAIARTGPYVNLALKEACDLVIRAFRAAAEREITIGDGLELWVVTKAGKAGDRVSAMTEGVSGETEKDLWQRQDPRYSVEKRLYTLPAH
jgi:20S proteasome alpha/beta subunit